MYYRTCETCGANLDPGEKCQDCKKTAARDAGTSTGGQDTPKGAYQGPKCTTPARTKQAEVWW